MTNLPLWAKKISMSLILFLYINNIYGNKLCSGRQFYMRLLHKSSTVETCLTDGFQMEFCSCTARLPSGSYNKIHRQKWYTMEQLTLHESMNGYMKIDMKIKWYSSRKAEKTCWQNSTGFFVQLNHTHHITTVAIFSLDWQVDQQDTHIQVA